MTNWDVGQCWTMLDNASTNQDGVRQCATSPQWASLGISQKNIEVNIQAGREAGGQKSPVQGEKLLAAL